MHIKKLSVQGFLSYKSVLKLPEFSPQHNVIVGRNGAGKSNFFNAISFVLGDDYSNMGATARNDLLHTGAGASVLRAFVEIVFDNSDGRLRGEPAEVTLQRTIGAKKDEFRLNRKHISKNDVVNLLESAGFSRSNPYYIVRQGKVDRICKMSNRERLDLLMEVAGTKVYDDRKRKSDEIMRDSASELERIDEILEQLNTRLEELEKEKKELVQYQEQDKNFRAIRYCIFNAEHDQTRRELTKIQNKVVEGRVELSEINAEVMQVAELIQDRERIERDANHARNAAQVELQRCEQEAVVVKDCQMSQEIRMQALNKQIATKETELKELKKESTLVEKEIASVRSSIDTEIRPRHEELADHYKVLTKEIQSHMLMQNKLNAKVNRHLQYSSAEERDDALRSSIQSLEQDLEANAASAQDRTAKIRQLRSKLSKDAEKQKHIEHSIGKLNTEQGAIHTNIASREEKRDVLQDEQKKIWQEDNDAKLKCDQQDFRLQNLKKDLASGLCPRNIREGLLNIEKVVKRDKIRGAYGPLVNLFSLSNDAFRVPVEVIAKNQLFNYVVDTEATAALLIKELQKHGGWLNFVPLDVVKSVRVQYPEDESLAVPLIKYMEFDERFSKAMNQVFGRVLICKDLTVATQQARLHRINCVTMQGEKAQFRGAIEAGFVDRSKTRVEVMHSIKNAKATISQIQETRTRFQGESAKKQHEITTLMGEVQKLTSKLRQVSIDIRDAEAVIVTLDQHRPHIENQIKELEMSKTLGTEAREVLQGKIDAQRAEIGTSLKNNLSVEEIQNLTNAQNQIATLSAREVELKKEVEEARNALDQKQSYLNDNLLRRKKDLDTRKHNAEGFSLETDSVDEARLADLQRQLMLCKKKVEKFKDQASAQQKLILEMQSRVETASAMQDEASTELETFRTEEVDKETELRESNDKMSQLLRRRQTLRSKKEETSRKIAELGSVPRGAVAQYSSITSKRELRNTLENISLELGKYGKVNKKALDQFINFTEERNGLLARREKLEAGRESIQQLMDKMDKDKDEAITRTFHDVQKHFQDVFKEIVADGSGNLIMQYRDGQDSETKAGDTRRSGQAASDSSDEDVEQGTELSAKTRPVDTYTGIAVEVSFSGTGETRTMTRLSGGQQAVVALSLIFAIQRCDPAPFYLLDEIDQALDSTHRQAVAALIRKQATAREGTTQFITSTFYPECVKVAAQCYGVYCKNKVSHINELTNEQALGFIRDKDEDDPEEEIVP